MWSNQRFNDQIQKVINLKRYKSSRYYQQQPDFFFSSVFLKVVPGLFFSGWPFVGLP